MGDLWQSGLDGPDVVGPTGPADATGEDVLQLSHGRIALSHRVNRQEPGLAVAMHLYEDAASGAPGWIEPHQVEVPPRNEPGSPEAFVRGEAVPRDDNRIPQDPDDHTREGEDQEDDEYQPRKGDAGPVDRDEDCECEQARQGGLRATVAIPEEAATVGSGVLRLSS